MDMEIGPDFRPFGSSTSSTKRTSSTKSATPPESYKKAREEVEKWLIAAPQQAFGDIVGNTEALAGLRDAIEAPVKHKELYAAYGMKMPKGAMLSGPPGCGKTMFARAAASEMKRLYAADGEFEFISISGSELQSPFVGVTEGYIKAIFTFAREYQTYHGHPLLVFMDEADVLLPDRTGRVRRVASWEESQVATFLAEMDGMQESGAFVLLATNRPEVIDQAVLRDGRCDFKITVKRPGADAIEAILRKNFGGILLGADDSLDDLVVAACEALFDPFKVIADLQTIGINLSDAGLDIQKVGHKHFLLEHIISGAMAASIPARAKRHAFARDKADGIARGVTVADVLRSVNDLFEENRTLDHSFALEEFKRDLVGTQPAAKPDFTAPPPEPG
ncbi:hypothetical protein AQZ49_01870 [Novosphingobium sp. FSW06-99]|nr:hypothetical protein AQZ49_01870 [Novosphingobium sp. FSW06-99]